MRGRHFRERDRASSRESAASSGVAPPSSSVGADTGVVCACAPAVVAKTKSANAVAMKSLARVTCVALRRTPPPMPEASSRRAPGQICALHAPSPTRSDGRDRKNARRGARRDDSVSMCNTIDLPTLRTRQMNPSRSSRVMNFCDRIRRRVAFGLLGHPLPGREGTRLDHTGEHFDRSVGSKRVRPRPTRDPIPAVDSLWITGIPAPAPREIRR